MALLAEWRRLTAQLALFMGPIFYYFYGTLFFYYIIPIFAIVSRKSVQRVYCQSQPLGTDGQTDGHIKAFRSSVLLPKGTKRTSIYKLPTYRDLPLSH